MMACAELRLRWGGRYTNYSSVPSASACAFIITAADSCLGACLVVLASTITSGLAILGTYGHESACVITKKPKRVGSGFVTFTIDALVVPYI